MTTPATFSEHVTAAPSGAGEVRALGETFAPDPQTGIGRYSIPLALQPGPAGIVPGLKLTYSTVGGNGPAGLGWDLGLATVQRRTDHGIPSYDDARDRFALQGDELVPQGGPDFRFRIEGRFARVRRLTGPGRDGWMVTERDGTRTLYGEVPEARLTDGAGRVAAWYVTRKQDVHGNEVNYRYERERATAEVRLVEITWGGCYRVLVRWDPRPDPILSSRTGFAVQLAHRIASLELQVERTDTSAMHTYLRYDLSYGVSPYTGRSLLTHVTSTGFDTDSGQRSLPPMSFTYGDADLRAARWHGISGDLNARRD